MKKTLKEIRKVVELISGVDDLSLKTRKREYIDARMIYYKIASEITEKSTVKIGMEVCKDHTTVIHGLKTFENLSILPEIQSVYLKSMTFLSNDFKKMKFSIDFLNDFFKEDQDITDNYFNYIKSCVLTLLDYHNKNIKL